MKRPRNIMRKFTIHEISGVDRPAQEPAMMVLMKRAPNKDTPNGGSTKTKETDMADEKEQKAAIEKAVSDAVAVATASMAEKYAGELALQKSLASLTDAEKVVYAKADEKGKAEWLKKSSAERAAEILKAADSDPVVYKAADGTEFKKSDDPRLVAMAKRNDDQAKDLAVEKAAREDATFAKRAGTELAHLKGTEKAKISLLKSVDRITDETERKEVAEILKAADAVMKGTFKKLGSGGDNAETDANTQIETLAKKYQEANPSVTYATAYSEVLKTEEGKRLYNETQKK